MRVLLILTDRVFLKSPNQSKFLGTRLRFLSHLQTGILGDSLDTSSDVPGVTLQQRFRLVDLVSSGLISQKGQLGQQAHIMTTRTKAFAFLHI